MALIIRTDKPLFIINSIKQMIDNRIVDTWQYDEDGDFTLSDEWRNKAWFSTVHNDNTLIFFLIGRNNVPMGYSEYSVYHGRLVELILNIFSNNIHDMTISSSDDAPTLQP